MSQRESVAILATPEQESSRTTRRWILLLNGSGGHWISWTRTRTRCWWRGRRVPYLYTINWWILDEIWEFLLSYPWKKKQLSIYASFSYARNFNKRRL